MAAGSQQLAQHLSDDDEEMQQALEKQLLIFWRIHGGYPSGAQLRTTDNHGCTVSNKELMYFPPP